MGIQKKFALLAGVAGVILALIAVTGYYLSYRMLSDSVQSELSAGMETRSTALDGWLEGKEQLAVAAANLMAKTDDGTKSPEELRALLSMSGEDTSQVSDLIVGNANGQIVGYHAGDLSAKLHPTEMRFYNEPKEAGGVVYMDTYVDKVTGKLVVTIAAPYYRADGSYGGAIDEDIFLDILQDEVKQLKYRGQGAGIIVDRAGVVMAAEDESLVGKNVTDVPGLAEHWDAMSTDGSGYFSLQQGGASRSGVRCIRNAFRSYRCRNSKVNWLRTTAWSPPRLRAISRLRRALRYSSAIASASLPMPMERVGHTSPTLISRMASRMENFSSTKWS